MIKSDPDNADKLRRSFQAHLKLINDKVNQTMQLLYKVPNVARKFNIELPAWVPKLHLVSEGKHDGVDQFQTAMSGAGFSLYYISIIKSHQFSTFTKFSVVRVKILL